MSYTSLTLIGAVLGLAILALLTLRNRWKNNLFIIPMGCWIVPPSYLASRLNPAIAKEFAINSFGTSKACLKEFSELNRYLESKGRKPLKVESDIPDKMSYSTFDFATFVDLKLINELTQNQQLMYYFGVEFDFGRRSMNINRGWNLTDEEFRIILAESIYQLILKHYPHPPRVFTPYTNFYRDEEAIERLKPYISGSISSHMFTEGVKSSVNLLRSLMTIKTFDVINEEDAFVVAMYVAIFTAWENEI